jgi:RNA polymerase sigma-70 factor (ECF subfamily)
LALKLELVRTATQPVADPPSFERIYGDHFNFTWRVLRYLGLRGSALDDGAQDCWLVVYRRLGEFEGRSDMHTWLFGIARNVARNHRRGLARRGPSESLPEDLQAAAPDPEASHSARETLSSVLVFLDQLSEQDRAIVACNLIERWSATETAAAVGVEVTIVYQRVRALRRMFKQFFEERER